MNHASCLPSKLRRNLALQGGAITEVNIPGER
jgi:hypothetical protein